MIQIQRWGNRKAIGAAASIVVMALFAGMSSKSAFAQQAYAVTDTGNFGILDLPTGFFQNLKTYDLTPNANPPVNATGGALLTGLAFATNQNIFAVDSDSGLYQINITDGTYDLVGQAFYGDIVSSGQTVRSIAFDKSTNLLYGIASDKTTGANTNLYRLQNFGGSGNSTLIKSLGVSSLGGLAIISSGGSSTFYLTQGMAAGANEGPVYQTNLSAGNATPIAGQPVAGFSNPVSALADVGGRLRAVDYSKRDNPINRTYAVSTTTGAATPQGVYDPNAMTATFRMGNILAITDGITPEPSTIGLLGMGLAMATSGLVIRRRKK